MAIAEAELTARVTEWVRTHKRRATSAAGEITPDTDLLAMGLLDSLGLIELIGFIESHEGCGVDLSEADPDDFSTVNGLCRLALSTQH